MLLRYVLAGLFVVFVCPFSYAADGDKLYLSFEQRVLLSKILNGVFQDDLAKVKAFDQAMEYAQKYSDAIFNQSSKQVKIGSFEEFLKDFKGDWPNSYSLAVDLQIIDQRPFQLKKYVSTDPLVQVQIEGYQKNQAYLLAHELGFNMIENEMFKYAVQVLSTQVTQRIDFSKINIPDSYKLQFMNVVEGFFKKLVGKIENVGTRVAQSKAIQIDDPAIQAFLSVALNQYFVRMSLSSKKQILSSMLGLSLQSSDVEKFELMVLNGGPQFQKLLQVVGGMPGISPEINKIFKKLESTVTPVPKELVTALMKAEAKNFDFVDFDENPLGVGTMAQVHKAKIQVNGQIKTVVVRFLKPGIPDKVEEDHRILSAVAPLIDKEPAIIAAGLPKLEQVVDQLAQTVSAELDFKATEDRQMQAYKVYNNKSPYQNFYYRGQIRMHVPKVIPAATPDTKIMVQELVPGVKLDKIADVYKVDLPDVKTFVAEAVAAQWVQEAFFGSGFFHSDLHQGNFMVGTDGANIDVYLLDYGMGGTLSQETRGLFLVYAAGLELNKADVIAESLWDLSERTANRITQSQFKELVQAQVREMSSGKIPVMDVDQWSGWAMEKGLKFSYNFISLNRGLVIISHMLHEAQSSLTFFDLAKKLAVQNLGTSLTLMNETKILQKKDFLRLAWNQFMGINPLDIEREGAQKANSKAKSKTKSDVVRCESLFLQ